jgi:hypothetical protein
MRICLLSLALLASSCDGRPPLDPDAPALPGGIEGTVVVLGQGAGADTFVTVYRADDPGPPLGTGRPVTFATVPASAYGAGEQALPSAPFALTGLPPGDYLVSALVDRDGDFSPFGIGLAGATCGDGVGAHVADLASSQPAAVSVRAGRQTREVTAVVGDPLLTERPAFTLTGATTLSASAAIDPTRPQLFRLAAVGVGATYAPDLALVLEGPCAAQACAPGPACPCTQPVPCQTSLPLWLVDADADGLVDPYPAEPQASAGALDVWPRVFLRLLDGPEGSYVHEGQERPEQWVAEAFPMAAELAAAAAASQGPEEAYGLPVGVPTAVGELSVTFVPVLRHYHRGGSDGVDPTGPYDLVDLRVDGATAAPTGAWSITVVGPTGQTWTIPNEIGLEQLPGAGGLDGTGQEAALVIVD